MVEGGVKVEVLQQRVLPGRTTSRCTPLQKCIGKQGQRTSQTPTRNHTVGLRQFEQLAYTKIEPEDQEAGIWRATDLYGGAQAGILTPDCIAADWRGSGPGVQFKPSAYGHRYVRRR